MVGASMVPGVGEGIDIADIIAGAKTRDLSRIGWGALGLAIPVATGATIKQMVKAKKSRFPTVSPVSSDVWKDHHQAFIGVTQSEHHADALEALLKGKNIDPSSFVDQDWEDLMMGKMFNWWPPPDPGPMPRSWELGMGTADEWHNGALHDHVEKHFPSNLPHAGPGEALPVKAFAGKAPTNWVDEWQQAEKAPNPNDYASLEDYMAVAKTGATIKQRALDRQVRTLMRTGRRGVAALAGLPRWTAGLPRRVVRRWEDLRLPMDEASVARRIEEQGYDPLLHGTGRRGEILDPNVPLDPDRPLFQVDNPDVAKAYGQTRRVYSRKPNQLTFDAEGAHWAEIPIENIRREIDPDRLEEFDRLVKIPDYQRASREGYMDTDALNTILKKMGYSGFDAQNLRDAPWSGLQPVGHDVADVPSFVRSTIDPGLVRLEGAKFNPRDLGLNLPLGGIAGLLGVGAAGAARRNYVERNRP